MNNMSNLDPTEIEKFNAIGTRWWDKTGEFKPLHEINPYRLNYIIQRTGDLKGKRVLDIGCGGGILSESMAIQGAIVTGIDLGEAGLNAGRAHAEQVNIEVDYRLIAAEALAEEAPESFDLITCMEMLEHVPDPQSILHACAKLAKPNADVILSTINRNPKAWLFAIAGAEYILNLVPRGTHDFKKFIKPSELCEYAYNAHLERQHSMGLHYNPLTKHYWLAENIDVNYMIHTIKR